MQNNTMQSFWKLRMERNRKKNIWTTCLFNKKSVEIWIIYC